jgi:hypothetical protein
MGEQADYIVDELYDSESYWSHRIEPEDDGGPPSTAIHYKPKKGMAYMRFHQKLIKSRIKWKKKHASKV